CGWSTRTTRSTRRLRRRGTRRRWGAAPRRVAASTTATVAPRPPTRPTTARAAPGPPPSELMRRKILVPLVTILVAAFGGLGLTLATGSSPELGLDLQGGVSVVLAPTGEASGEQLDQALAIIRDRVDALGVAEPDITRQGDNIVVQLPGAKNRDRAL